MPIVPGRPDGRTAGAASRRLTRFLREMDDFGIERAMVSHYLAEPFPVRGNQRLLREIRGQGRLMPCWIVIPTT